MHVSLDGYMYGDPASTVQIMKQEPGGDMVIIGDGELAAHFAKNKLIDEYRIKLEPTVLGKGKSWYNELSETVRLKLINSKISASGVVDLYYQVIKKIK